MKLEDVQRKTKNIIITMRVTQEDSLFMKKYEISPSLVFENALEELKEDEDEKGSFVISKKEYFPINIFTKLKRKYPAHVIFIQCGWFYEFFGEDAKEINRLFGLKLGEKQGLAFTGFPCTATKFNERKEMCLYITAKLKVFTDETVPLLVIVAVMFNDIVEPLIKGDDGVMPDPFVGVIDNFLGQKFTL